MTEIYDKIQLSLILNWISAGFSVINFVLLIVQLRRLAYMQKAKAIPKAEALSSPG